MTSLTVVKEPLISRMVRNVVTQCRISHTDHWLGNTVLIPMQIEIDFLCRESILAAPLVLDLVLFLDLARHEGNPGVAFVLLQHACPHPALPNTIVSSTHKLDKYAPLMQGEDLITHLGLEY